MEQSSTKKVQKDMNINDSSKQKRVLSTTIGTMTASTSFSKVVFDPLAT